MKKTQHGIAVIESVLILLIVGLLGGTGYYVWHIQKTTDKTNSDTFKAGQPQAIDSQANPNKSLTIKEWGVKVNLPEASNVTYNDLSCGNPDCSLTLSFKDSVTTDTSCKPILNVIQENEGNQSFTPNIKIGTSSYALETKFANDAEESFSSCSDAVNQLREKIRQEVNVSSISSI